VGWGPRETQALAGAEMVAVDLIGRGRITLDDERAQVGADVEVAAAVEWAVRQRCPGNRAEGAKIQLLECDGGQRILE